VNSNLRRILVLTQFNSHRLLEHLQFGWTFLSDRLQEFIHVLPAQQNPANDHWYSGTADAVFQNVEELQSHAPAHVLVLAGDQIYKMDYQVFMADHLDWEADMSIACLEVPRLAAGGLGVVATNGDRVTGFHEKPREPPPGLPGRPDHCLASMGLYLFKADFLFAELKRDAADPTSSHDFGRDLIPRLVDRARVFAHRFGKSHIRNLDKPPYWRDVGTVDSFWEANLDLTYVEPALNLYDYDWPVFTHQEQLPPAKFVHSDPGRNGVALSSIVANGCVVSGASVHGGAARGRHRPVRLAAQRGGGPGLPRAGRPGGGGKPRRGCPALPSHGRWCNSDIRSDAGPSQGWLKPVESLPGPGVAERCQVRVRTVQEGAECESCMLPRKCSRT